MSPVGTLGPGAVPGETAMVADACPLPPEPVQVSVYWVVLAGDSRAEPLSGSEPDQPPPAVQPVAFVELHVKVALPPTAMAEGLAPRLTVGAGDGGVPWSTDTVTAA